MHKSTRISVACAVAFTMTSSALAQPAAPTQNAKPDQPEKNAAETSVTVETVVVTANKRKERLQDVPLAITAFSSEALERLGVEKFGDYMTLVPNLSQAGGGTPGVGTVVMRGLYTGSQQTTNTTAFYVGEAPFSSSGALAVGALITPDPDLVDVARIEILKGPQGTLYGASSLGGLIRIVPKEPDFSGLSGSVKLAGSSVANGGMGNGVRASVNLPVSENVALLVSAFSRKDAGSSFNTKTGVGDLGFTKAQGGSVSGLARITKDWKVSLRVLSQELDSLGVIGQDNVQGTLKPVTGERQFSGATNGPASVRYELGELSTEYTTPVGTLTASLSRVKNRTKIQTDYTGPYGVFVAAALPPNFSIVGDLDVNLKGKTSSEVRFSTTRLGNFEGVAGLFYTDEDNDYGTKLSTFLASGAPAPAPFNNFLDGVSSSQYKERAVFVNGSYYLNPEIDFGAGLRYSTNTQSVSLRSTGVLGAGPGSRNFDFNDSSATYQATARWRPSRDISMFARYSTGYRPGGPQTNANPPPGTPTTFKPDTVANAELGIKGVALDNRLRFDASVYRIDWKDVQLNGLVGGRLLLANAGKAVVKGAEVQLQYRAPGDLQLGANLGYNDARLTEVGTSTATFLGAAQGDRLPGSPRISAALFADWRFSLGSDMTASLGSTLRHQGDKLSSYAGSALNPSFTMPAYTMMDLRASLEWKRYTLRFRVDNATNKLGYTSYATNKVSPRQTTLPSTVTLNAPRTVSLSFGVDF
jgi:iron complex outermembrane recepter protein